MSGARRKSPLRPTTAKAMLAAIVSMSFFFYFFSSPASAADVAAKFPSGASAGFMPFAFGGVHSQKEKSPVFLEEAAEPRYVVEVSSKSKERRTLEEDEADETFAPSSQRQTTKNKKKKQRTISLADRSGRSFECTIPVVASADEGEGIESEAKSGNNENASSSENLALSLLRPLEGTCLYRIEDTWWTYEFCFERHVRQFHKEPGERGKRGSADVEFWLGRWGEREDEGASSSSNDGDDDKQPHPSHYNVSISNDRFSDSPSFVSSVYRGGDPCDLLNGKPREAEVKFVCHEQPLPTTRPSAASAASPQQPQTQQIVQPPPNVVLSAKELSTCRYEVVVGVAGLCSHSEFRDREPETATIECSPVSVIE